MAPLRGENKFKPHPQSRILVPTGFFFKIFDAQDPSSGFSLEAGNRRTPAATFGISAAYFCWLLLTFAIRTLKVYFFILKAFNIALKL